jgi:uncharacterized protein YcbK (DUF882 family)
LTSVKCARRGGANTAWPSSFHKNQTWFGYLGHTTGVAKNSLPNQAEAIDLRMPGIDTLELRKAALSLRRGGMGYYPHSDFIHVDVGRVRQWCFDCSSSLIAAD